MTLTVGVVTASQVTAVRPPDGLMLALALAVLISAAGALAIGWHAAGSAAALAIATFLAVLPWISLAPGLPDRLRLALIATAPLVVAATAEVALLWRATRRRLSPMVIGLAGTATVVHFLGYDPFEHPACGQVCARVPAVLAPVLDTRSAVGLASVLTVAAAAASVVAVVRGPRVRLLTGATVLAAAALSGLVFLRWLGFDAERPQVWVWPLEPFAVAIVGAAAVGLHLRIVRIRGGVERLADTLSPGSVLSGPVVGVHFAADHSWLDIRGVEVRIDPPTARTLLLYDGQTPIVRLVLADRVEPGNVMAGLAPAALLALRNAHLNAVLQARLAEVRASQRRVVAASDAERHRIERDLHDGAQQRLVGAGFQLQVARSVPDHEAAERIESAARKVREALAQLRGLAHGIFPGVLIDEGLGPALRDLVASSDVPARLELRMTDEPAPDVAMAAYAMVVGVLGGVVEPTARTTAEIVVRQEAGVLTAQVRLDPGGAVVRRPDLIPVADRIGAVGGDLVVDGDEFQAVIPCG
ncbi:sensor histidine kinase [Kribbella capetownensis]|nr:histidine kinase [Kribbella capetownensis]